MKIDVKLSEPMRLGASVASNAPLSISTPSEALLSAKLQELEQRYKVPLNSFAAAGFDCAPGAEIWDEYVADMRHSMEVFAQIIEEKGGVENVTYSDFVDTDMAYWPMLDCDQNVTVSKVFNKCIDFLKGVPAPLNINLTYIYSYGKVFKIKHLRNITTSGYYGFAGSPAESITATLTGRNFRSTFYNCTSLKKIAIECVSPEVYSTFQNPLEYTFSNTELEVIDLNVLIQHHNDVVLSSLAGTFLACHLLKKIIWPDRIIPTAMTDTFYFCISLSEVEGVIDMSRITNVGSNTFINCDVLNSIRLKGVKTSLDLRYSPLDAESVEFLITNLQAVQTRQTLRLSPAAAEHITDDLYYELIDRNWSLSY